ncbi:hypothetical protein [Geodermatophilus sp. URMC 60]
MRVVLEADDLPFLDLDALQTTEFLRVELALGLASLGVTGLDTSTCAAVTVASLG